MSHLQRHKDYGIEAVHDEEINTILNELHQTYQSDLTFVQVVLEIAGRCGECPSPNTLIDLNLDFDCIPTDVATFFRNIVALARQAPLTAAACLDTSSISRVFYRAATGGVKETKRPYRAAFFIDRFMSRVQEMKDRQQTPFAVLQALATGPDQVDFTAYEYKYEIFAGPQETDGRIQAPSFPKETVTRGVLLCLLLTEVNEVNVMTQEQQKERENWFSRLRDELTESKFRSTFDHYRRFVASMDPTERVSAMMCTMAGRNFIVERAEEALSCYYWDPEPLQMTRTELLKYSEDANGPKLYGYYWRMAVSWSLVFLGSLLAILSGSLNWAKRENLFERVNDVFQTFLLVLSVPAFTVKIAATNGEQAIKDWLVGARRIDNMEELEKQIHRRIKCNKRRGWLSIQRVKCETDDKQNWTAPDNMCFKTAHLDGSLRAKKDRNMADLELVFGTNGKTARSWVEISNETNVLGKDVNHLQFTCGNTNVQRTAAFFSHTPSKRVWFA